MGATNKRVILVIGASASIGRACADLFHQRGEIVYGASRDWSKRGDAPFNTVTMDITQDESVRAAVAIILAQEGRLDALINAAGFTLAGAVEDAPMEDVKTSFETNVYGVLRAIQAVLPAMREQRRGLIVNVSSIGGAIGVPFHGLYSASKFAVEGLSEALRMEVQPFGVRVALIQPGDLRTDAAVKMRKHIPPSPAYAERAQRAIATMEQGEAEGADPQDVARLIGRLLDDPSPRLRYRVGKFLDRAAVTLKRALPPGFFEWGFMKYYGLR